MQHTRQQPSASRPKPPFPPQHQLEGKVALVTGGDSGIGRAVSVLFAREGASVAIVYLPEEQSDAEETKRAIEQEGAVALLCPGDVTVASFCREAVANTVERFGRLDVLVNNAAFQKHQPGLEARSSSSQQARTRAT